MSLRSFKNLPGSSGLSGLVFAQGASAAIARKANLSAAVNPTVNDDSSAGYDVLSIWANTTANRIFMCSNASVGVAVWQEVSSSATGIRETITVANTFAAGNIVRKTAGGYTKAQGDSAADAEVLGIIESASGTSFTIIYFGKITLTAHGFTIGDVLFLSAGTAGLLTATEPTTAGQVSKPVALVLDANTLLVTNLRGSVVSPNTAGCTSTVLSNVNQTLTRGTSTPFQKYSGTLSGAVVVNLSRTGAISGDEFKVDLSALVTTAVNTLTFQENGAGSLEIFNTANTVTGFVHFVYDGSAWIIFTQNVTLS